MVVSAGPAVTNTLTGVLVARDNGWPVIVMGGRRPLDQDGIGYFQELDAVPIFRSVTKWAVKVEQTSEIISSVIKAFEIACSVSIFHKKTSNYPGQKALITGEYT